MSTTIKFEMAQAIARAILADRGRFTLELVEAAEEFTDAGIAKYWRNQPSGRWETASISWTAIDRHREEWEGKLDCI